MNLKTITDEGKREFERLFPHELFDRDMLTFLDTYAENVATETMKAILPEGKHDELSELAVGWDRCRAAVEQAFQTFLGKV